MISACQSIARAKDVTVFIDASLDWWLPALNFPQV